MPMLKPPPRMTPNATIQVRVEEEVDLKLRKYAEFIDATPAFVVAESLKMVFNKDAEFREWFTGHGEKPARTRAEKAAPQEQTQMRSGLRTMSDEMPYKTATK